MTRQLPHVSAANRYKWGPQSSNFLKFSLSPPKLFSNHLLQLTSPSPPQISPKSKQSPFPHLSDQMMDPKFGKPMSSGPYAPGRVDLDQMPDTPTRGAHHRRAHSETFFRFPDLDDILVDGVLADLNLELPPAAPPPKKSPSTQPLSHLRSLSVDADFFEGLVLDGPPPSAAARHRHSNSMDGESSTTSSEVDSSAKKAMAADRLAELALIDPKRAKRILANRQSAARSKERKTRYTGELERKVQTLQSEATKLSAQITLLQRDTGDLTAENKELKLKLQAMEQQAHLRDALNEALRNELQWLKITACQMHGANRGSSSPFSPVNYFSNQQPPPPSHSGPNNPRPSP